MLRVVFDMTLAGRERAGTYVYATQLLAALRDVSEIQIVETCHPRPHGNGNLVLRAANAVDTTDWAFRRLLNVARKSGADLIHVPTHVAPLVSRWPVVIALHDVTFRTGTDDWLWGLYARLTTWATVRGASRIIALTEHAKGEIEAAYPRARGKIRVVHSGVSTAYSPRLSAGRVAEACRSLGVESPYVLAVGVQGRRKNHERLLDAFLRLRSRPGQERLRLVFVGKSGRSTPALQKASQSLAPGTVSLLGQVEDSVMPALYQGAELFVFPSLAEGFGLPILEAMASGVAVVTSNCSAMPEVAGDAAVMVDPLDVESIALGMRRVLTDSDLRRQLVEKGLARAAQFTWRRTAVQTAEVYRDAMAPAKSHRSG